MAKKKGQTWLANFSLFLVFSSYKVRTKAGVPSRCFQTEPFLTPLYPPLIPITTSCRVDPMVAVDGCKPGCAVGAALTSISGECQLRCVKSIWEVLPGHNTISIWVESAWQAEEKCAVCPAITMGVCLLVESPRLILYCQSLNGGLFFLSAGLLQTIQPQWSD